MPPILVIARLTIQEASRRRLLLALVVLTLIVVGFSAWGFQKITTVTRSNGQPPSQEEIILITSQLLIVVTFMFSGVLALSAAVVAGPLISSEVESGLLLSILARPVRRSEEGARTPSQSSHAPLVLQNSGDPHRPVRFRWSTRPPANGGRRSYGDTRRRYACGRGS